jgi:hypothetical protein
VRERHGSAQAIWYCEGCVRGPLNLASSLNP